MDHFSTRGILSGPIDGRQRFRLAYPEVPARIGLVAVHLGSRFRGAVSGFEHDGGIRLRSPNTGLERIFAPSPGAFSVDGVPVTLVRPRGTAGAQPKRPPTTASGSIPGERRRARVARASRILVEGVHDAELVEKVWGDDLRAEGVVVERLDGIDDLVPVVASMRPGPEARLGILVDHLVASTKESRIVEGIRNPHVLVTGTPFVDVWQAIRPSVLGLDAWPLVPRGRPWKEGICEIFAEENPGRLWRKLLGKVQSYTDLEPALVGAVESLIDFVTIGD